MAATATLAMSACVGPSIPYAPFASAVPTQTVVRVVIAARAPDPAAAPPAVLSEPVPDVPRVVASDSSGDEDPDLPPPGVRPSHTISLGYSLDLNASLRAPVAPAPAGCAGGCCGCGCSACAVPATSSGASGTGSQLWWGPRDGAPVGAGGYVGRWRARSW